MNLYEHLEVVERASLLTKEEILTTDSLDARELIRTLDEQSLLSFLAILRFRQRVEKARQQ